MRLIRSTSTPTAVRRPPRGMVGLHLTRKDDHDARLEAVADPVDFGRDILPILSDTWYQCQGPDAGTREATCGST